jgi:hypothetical protein
MPTTACLKQLSCQNLRVMRLLREVRRFADVVFALSNDFDDCSGNRPRVRLRVQAGGHRAYSEFRRRGGCYKTRALLQSGSTARKDWSNAILFPGCGRSGAGRHLWRSVGTGMPACAQDAASLDHVQAQLLGTGDQFARFRTGIEPELADTFALELIEQPEADSRRYVKAYLVERGHGEGVERPESGQSLNLLEQRMDGKDDPARIAKCPDRFVPEFRPVGAGTDHGDRFGGQMRSFRIVVRHFEESV